MKKHTIEIMCMSQRYEEYLRDESRQNGEAIEICFPQTREQLSEALDTNLPVTIQGARTGLDGRAVPHGGRIVNMQRMNRVLSSTKAADGSWTVTAEAGVSMSQLGAISADHFFAPAPTELTATLGGAVLADARGIFADHYGGMTEHCTEKEMLHVAGHEALLSATVRLLPKPKTVWAIAFLFDDDAAARGFSIRAAALPMVTVNEYLDAGTLRCLMRLRTSAQRLQALPETGSAAAMIYTELHAACEDDACAGAEELMALSVECGCAEEDTWALCGEADAQLLRDFRHAAQEAVHAEMDEKRKRLPALYALGADLTLKPEDFEAFNATVRALDTAYACFGHIAGGRTRLSFMPEDDRALQRTEAFLHELRENRSV